MSFSLTLQNYRCFSEPKRMTLRFKPGLIALVGPNNSGKSSILRFVYEFRNLFLTLMHAGQAQAGIFSFAPSVADAQEVFSNTNGSDLRLTVAVDEPHSMVNPPVINSLEITISRTAPMQFKGKFFGHDGTDLGTPNVIPNPLIARFGNTEHDYGPLSDAFSILYESLYLAPFRNPVNVGAQTNYYDIPIGSAFVAEWANAQSGTSIAKNLATQSVVDDIKDIFRFEQLEIIPTPDHSNLHFKINKRPYKLSEVGSGLAQFVLVLYAAAKRTPRLILIDEPESNLHPTLQADFTTRLHRYASFATLFSTHSLGLARTVADGIYTVYRDKYSVSEVREFEALGNVAEYLGEMSYSGSFDLGYRKILLVEGRTDIKVFQEFLRKHRMDHEVTVLCLGGSTLVNRRGATALTEIRRITTNVWAVVDSEDASGSGPTKPVSEFAQVCGRLGINCHVLKLRSIENYFSASAIKTVLGQDFDALSPHETTPAGWNKELNWKIASIMSWDEFEGTDLGAYIEDLVKSPTTP